MRPPVHRFAIAALCLEAISIVSGAAATGSRIAFVTGFHQGLALSAIVVAILLCLRDVRSRAGWLVLASVALAALTGWPALHVVWHAICGHLSLGLAAAAVVISAPDWANAVVCVDLGSWGALRPAGIVTPGAVMVQISLGALYRHEVIGVMPHMLGAMVVALLTLVISTVLLQHFSGQPQLKSAATWLLAAVLVQVCLGIAVFMMVLLDANHTRAFAWTASAHVSVGALTLAASVVTALRVARLCADDTRGGRSRQSTGPST